LGFYIYSCRYEYTQSVLQLLPTQAYLDANLDTHTASGLSVFMFKILRGARVKKNLSVLAYLLKMLARV